MARAIASSGQALYKASPSAVPAADGSVSFWLNPNWSSGDSGAHYFYNWLNVGETARCTFLKYSDNQIYCGWVTGAGGDDRITISDSGLFTSGTWAHWCVTWSDSADLVTLYKNGTQVSQRTSALVTAAVTDKSTIGTYNNTGTTEGMDGSIAEFALWNSVIDTTAIASLAKGFSPSMVRAHSLLLYLPLIGRSSPENSVRGNDAYTLVGGVSSSDHPRVIHPF